MPLHPENELSINPSQNESILDVIDRVEPGRRRFIKFAAGTAAMSMTAFPLSMKTANAAPPPVGGIGFAQLAADTVPVTDAVSVAPGYTARVFYSWGDPISGATPFDPTVPMTEAEQLVRAGMHHDGMHFFPFPTGGAGGLSNERGILAINHEYTDEGLLHNSTAIGMVPQTAAMTRASQAAHGVSMIEVRKVGGVWSVVRPSPFARRVTANTPMKFTGPAAGNALLKTAADPNGTDVLGTANNCAHGYTPWGTYLTCEENFNGYFGTTSAPFTATALENRYGINAAGFGYRWHLTDPRFDIRTTPNEPNRFGWVVEIDPFNPRSVPVKRTALGRFKHESAAVVVGTDNKVAVYMGDDERGDYVYKFVCSGLFNPTNRGANRNLLDSGTLYVAKFNANGAGVWLPLVFGQGGLTPANGWVDQGDVVVRTRQAADREGATMMDRPEWIAVHPTTREVYVTLTNNNRRGTNPPSVHAVNGSTTAGTARPPVDDANPRVDNRYGHIVRWRETGGDLAATTFEWDIFVLCGDSLSAAANLQGNIVDSGVPGSSDYGAPDGLWFDKDGRLWVQTDQPGDALGDWVNIGSNTMSAIDPSTGSTYRFLTSPRNCEVTGVISTPDGKTMWINIQHPGEDWSGSFTARSSWPDSGVNGATNVPLTKPRSSTVVITKDDGGVIGAGSTTVSS
ncbi:MAG: PhoX family phosphatase [Proteobacteria bacterium]|nr:PhoX family phosphatase [Burkholderiales bacterium]